MNLRQVLPIVFLAPLMLAPLPGRATDSHAYGNDEYATIRDGLAPNRQISLAAHGDGDMGSENFHIWLMVEPAHRKLVALPGIGDDNNLDTGPASYRAQWSADLRRVAVSFRSDRRIVTLNLYTIENRKPVQIAGPTLFREAAGRDVNDDDDLRRSIANISWRGSDRFGLTERRQFLTRDAGFADRLGRYAKVTDKLDDGRLVVDFSAEADCALSGDRYRIIGVRPGKFDD